MNEVNPDLSSVLWRIYRRPERPSAWAEGGNLPWDDPDFSIRMLREHLDESHGAASRVKAERQQQIDWMTDKLGLKSGQQILDVTCGPGLYATELARRGSHVTGIDFSPSSITYAKELAREMKVDRQCVFRQQDVRQMRLEEAKYDAALFIYGQLAVFTRQEAQDLLTCIAQSLKPGARLCVELLDQERVDKKDSNWWYTDNRGLWGDAPFLHLGERFWLEAEAISLERFFILHLESGELQQITLCDQTYATVEMEQMMKQAGFSQVEIFPAWDGLPLYDAPEWIVYVAER
jgi:ubiquinone/menaquinone biosynthesis C-methylase UbiE